MKRAALWVLEARRPRFRLAMSAAALGLLCGTSCGKIEYWEARYRFVDSELRSQQVVRFGDSSKESAGAALPETPDQGTAASSHRPIGVIADETRYVLAAPHSEVLVQRNKVPVLADGRVSLVQPVAGALAQARSLLLFPL